MGSSTVTNINNMADDKKKSIKCLIKNIFGKKKDKVKETDIKKETLKNKETINEQHIKEETQLTAVDAVLATFKKLEIEKKREAEDELANFSFSPVEDDERDNFTYKVVEECRTERTDSHSSEDSGFSEKYEERTEQKIEKEEEVIEKLQNLKLDEKKKKCLVPVSRQPIRNRVLDFGTTLHPYGLETADSSFKKINQVNKHTFSGGQVIVASRQDFEEVNIPFQKDDTNQELQNFSDGLAMRGVDLNSHFDLDIIQEYINEESVPEDDISILHEFIKDNCEDQNIATITNLVQTHIEQNPIEELENTNHLNYEKIENLDSLLGFEDKLYTNIFPTPPSTDIMHSPKSDQFYNNFLSPPRSDIIPSPMSDSMSLYPSNSEFTYSPNSDCEKYQEIPQFFEEPAIISDIDSTEKKERERNTSTSSLSMKNFKDLQKELAASFSKKDCCEINRKSCKQIFQEYFKKLKTEERKSLCFKVAGMDLKTVYGVLHHVLLGLSRDAAGEDLHLALFALLCERVLAQKPQLFAEDFGLSILKAATLRCPQRPLLARYVVQCIRLAIKHEPSLAEGKDCLFKEIDAQGDTLVTACARAGDTYASALAELVRRDNSDTPLFNLQHVNTEGYSALHVACRHHSAATPCLHVVHVLLEHGGADIWKGDVKGGDTAVHMAVNSPSCDLQLVLLLFRHLDRKLWKKLAHVPNRSSVTPLDYARCASKSTTRQNYPAEVLDFLKKCR